MNFVRGAMRVMSVGLSKFREILPLTVHEVDARVLNSIELIEKQDMLSLCKEEDTYVCILCYPPGANIAFCLFRLAKYQEAKRKFDKFVKVFPQLCQADQSVVTAETLQKCSDIILKEKGWNCAHVAAKLKLSKCFQHAPVQQKMEEEDPVTSVTPLMVAAEEDNMEIVSLFVEKGVSLDKEDYQGYNVYHYAAKTNNPKLLELLTTENKGTINKLNKFGESPIHIACAAQKPEMLEALIKCGADPSQSEGDRAPIHCALAKNDIKCLDILLEHDEKQILAKDKKNEGSPLHWAKSPEAVYLLSDKGAELDPKSKSGDTPLHTMIREDRLDCAVSLLVQGADAAMPGRGGNNALHLAITKANSGVVSESYSIVQALIVFGSDVNLMNEQGYTPRHLCATLTSDHRPHMLYLVHRVGAKRCPKQMKGCNAGCAHGGDDDGLPGSVEVNKTVVVKKALEDAVTEFTMSSAMERSSSLAKLTRDQDGPNAAVAGERVLSLDGGGIRGMVLIALLQGIEQATGKPIKSSFDWIGGTSTGGMIALAVAMGKPMRYILGTYFKLKEQVFTGSRPYESESLETFLRKEFGEETMMTAVEKPKVMVTAVLADRNPADLHMFKNFETPGIDYEELVKNSKFDLPPRPHEQQMWRAARSSGAAPTYFRAFGRFLDGGLMANNPTIDILTEIHEYHMGLRATKREKEVKPIHVVVSLGTGQIPIKIVEGCEVYKPSNVTDLYKSFLGAKNLGMLFVEAATQSEGRVVDRGRAWCSMIGAPFFRFSPQLTDEVLLDCKSDAILIAMLWECKCYINDNWEQFERLAKLLE